MFMRAFLHIVPEVTMNYMYRVSNLENFEYDLGIDQRQRIKVIASDNICFDLLVFKILEIFENAPRLSVIFQPIKMVKEHSNKAFSIECRSLHSLIVFVAFLPFSSYNSNLCVFKRNTLYIYKLLNLFFVAISKIYDSNNFFQKQGNK